VLRPGGHFVFLTPNLRNPLLVLNRIGKALPLVQTGLVSRFYGRRESDTFPVRYRGEHGRRFAPGLLRPADSRVGELRVVQDPTVPRGERVHVHDDGVGGAADAQRMGRAICWEISQSPDVLRSALSPDPLTCGERGEGLVPQ